MNSIKKLKMYKTVYRNYISVMYHEWRGKTQIKVILKNGDLYKLNSYYIRRYPELISNKNININPSNLTDSNIKFSYKDKDIILMCSGGDLPGVFGREDYKFLDVDNENVIDIGANIGDSPIYFAINNAKIVIALEPYPYTYNIALENIIASNLKDQIILLNAGYGKDGTTYVDPEFKSTGGSDLKNFKNGKEIEIISLRTLLNKYNINHAVLKMDCEGCEYNILNEDNNTLRKFIRIEMEYHYGYEKIKKKLEEAGFKVKYTEPIKVINRNATDQNMELGHIFGELVL